MRKILQKHWFLLGLCLAALVTLADRTETISGFGKWLIGHKGPDAIIVLIFFFSGLSLVSDQIKKGVSDIRTITVALVIIFVAAPLTALGIGMAPLPLGVRIGLFVVAIMPTTLTSGVIMTGAAGGNMANALMITILANTAAIFTVPFSLDVLLESTMGDADFILDKAALMFKIAFLVLLPLLSGLVARSRVLPFFKRFSISPSVLNQCLVIIIICMALSRSRSTILKSLPILGMVIPLSFVFHATLLGLTWFSVWLFGIGPGKREGVIFMGSQKTLPLAVLLQLTLFPQYGDVLVMCVVHHVVHLMIDGYLVGKLGHRRRCFPPSQ